jgi:hypothetical protein
MEMSMSAYATCIVVLLVAVFFAPPVKSEVRPAQPVAASSLCLFIRSAVNETPLEAEANERVQTSEIVVVANGDLRSSRALEGPFFAAPSNLRADRELFESSLVNWMFFEDLAPQQRAILGTVLARCGADRVKPSNHASAFGRLNASERATFVGITHAMLNTRLLNRESGREMGSALQLVEELLDIHGENSSQPSDHQFQLIVRPVPDALQRLQRAASFEVGENHIFHKDYPLSFRQFRNMGVHGEEAGLHICVTRDGRFAEIHIDYRFGLLHLTPTNSDVRADGNHQRHVDRWPQLRFATRRVPVRRAVLQGQD